VQEFSPSPDELSKDTLSKASGFAMLPLPTKKSLFPVNDFIFSLLETNAIFSLKWSLYKFFIIIKLLSFEASKCLFVFISSSPKYWFYIIYNFKFSLIGFQIFYFQYIYFYIVIFWHIYI